MKKILLPITLLALFVVIAASCVKDRVASTNVVPPPVNTNSDTLIYYWNFNVDSADLFNPTIGISASAVLVYAGASYDSVQPGTTVNAQGGDTVLNGHSAALRLRNPAGPFAIVIPTTGYKNIVLKYAEDHTKSGATTNTVTYTVNGGITWKNTAIATYATYAVDSLDTNNGFQLISFDFSSDDSVSDNANFEVQINFSDGSTGTSGNDRFDNITVYGVPK